MSDRIDEYHGPDAKPLTTAEVEGMPHHTQQRGSFVIECSMHVLVRRDDLLATTRALETARAEIGRMEALAVNMEALTRMQMDGMRARAEKAEREISEARVMISKLVEALEACAEWMGDNVPSDGWGCRDRRADADRIETLKIANAALAKAKEAKP